MSGSGIETTDHSPAVAGGSWVFALAASTFLIALVIAALVMPSESEITPAPPATSDFSRGRAIFNGEGCIECHSRLVRSRDRGMGPVANAGMLMNETGRPGSSRIGPDLQNIAGRYPPSLLETRLTDPRGLQPETLSYAQRHPHFAGLVVALVTGVASRRLLGVRGQGSGGEHGGDLHLSRKQTRQYRVGIEERN